MSFLFHKIQDLHDLQGTHNKKKGMIDLRKYIPMLTVIN